MTATPQDFVWDEMAKARDLKVVSVAADDNSVTYRISFDVAFDRSMQQAIGDEGAKRGRRVTSQIARYARSGLKLFFRDNDTPDPTSRGSAVQSSDNQKEIAL